MTNKEIWKKPEMHTILKIRPEEDILPIRMEYSETAENPTKNIGINYLSSDKELWYTVQDVISSKILSGKTPEIIDAITFIPEGIQENLKDVKISNIIISAKDDFIRKVIEKRMKVKKSDREDKDQIQLILKIIANATSYGIYIEENSQSLDKEEDVDVYSIDNFTFYTKNLYHNRQSILCQLLFFQPLLTSILLILLLVLPLWD